jgi:hypothetical protein
VIFFCVFVFFSCFVFWQLVADGMAAELKALLAVLTACGTAN